MFENDVIWYGTQTARKKIYHIAEFENDVIWYGTQTLCISIIRNPPFENDVIWYGTQTKIFCQNADDGLRMM